MLTASMLAFNGAGRIRQTNTGPAVGGNGFTPVVAAGPLLVLNKVPDVFCNGIGYDSGSSAMCASSAAVASFHQGMPFDATGQVATDTVGAITTYVAGIPRTATGALAVAALE